MLTYVVRRVALSIPVLLIASIAVFIFVHQTSDPLARFSQVQDPNTRTNEAVKLDIEQPPCHIIHLAQPLTAGGTTEIRKCTSTPVLKQYGHWLNGFVHARMGASFVNGQPVSLLIRQRFKNTLQLIFFGVIVSATLAIAIGVYSAVRQYSALDYTFTGLSFVGLSMPAFWFGLIAIQIFSFQLKQWFHLSQPLFFSIGIHGSGGGLLDYFRHLALPVLTLTVQIIASWSRYQRSSMLDVMSADYIRTARAKGLAQWKVVGKHALRNALIPLMTVMAVDIGALFGGLIITEKIFSWPGMGALFIDSLENGDTNVLLPWLMVAAVFIIMFNLLADVLYGTLDPRVRFS
jgi:peptide/nickel transport system permease protein